MKKRILFSICAVFVVAIGFAMRTSADSPIIINEFMYNPLDGEGSAEYVELYNAGYGPVDLSKWRFSDGISFAFPQGTVLDEGEYLVVCKDQDYIRFLYAINNTVGNFSGSLNDAGERVRLVNAAGIIMDEVRYGAANPWPASPGGSGYSLELRNPSLDNELPSSWFAGITFFGTPGRQNSVFYDPHDEVVSLIKPGDNWRFLRGWIAPSDPADAWHSPTFPDASWEEGPSGFGAGDGDDATILDDMQNNYVSLYIRKEFTIEDASAISNLRLTIDYDDGFVAYLNDQELVRRGLGEPETPVYYDTRASSHEAGTPERFDLGKLSGLLQTGKNLLAIECHNESLTNGDLSMIPSLEYISSSALFLINEFQCEPEGWIELYNPSSESLDLGGYFLTDDPADLTKYRILDGTMIEKEGFVEFSNEELGFPMSAAGGGILLMAPDQTTVIDSFSFAQQYSGMSYGRYPDGGDDTYFLSTPTPGQPNRAIFRRDIVINEIMYHPLPVHSDAEYIELYNSGESDVQLNGWELAGAIRYSFPPGLTLPSGGYLVISDSAITLSSRYGITGVLGDFSGRLRNYGEGIILKDALGNPVDIVHYGDDLPWPPQADGLGPSLELTHPELENGFGQFWAPSDSESAPEGTPGRPNSTFGKEMSPAIVQTSHFPVVPGVGDPVTVTTRVIDDGSVSGVTLFFRRDGEAQFTEVTMIPSGEGSLQDEIYEASIPAQSNPVLMEFYIEAEDDDSNVSTFPDSPPQKSCLYLVDGAVEPDDLPLYRVLMTNANYTELRTRGVSSNVLLDATFICGNEVWYNVGLRYRGFGSRGAGEPNMSYRVRFPDHRPFVKVRKLNLNGQNPSSQWLGWDFIRRTGLPYSDTRGVYFKLNDSFRGYRLRVAAVDEDFLRQVFPEDSSGNLYRGDSHFDNSGVTRGGDLAYRGEDPEEYRPHYLKQTNLVEDDFSDLIHLCDVFTNTPDDQFEEAVSQLINVDEWITYFAINNCLNNREGAIYLDAGDDYFIYRYPYDGKWYIIPWDLDSCLNDPTESIFRQTLPSIVRFLSSPNFRLMYYRKLQHLLDYEFSERQMFAAIESLQGQFSISRLQGYESVVTGRIADIRSQIVTELTVEPPAIGSRYIREGDSWRFFRGKEAPSDPFDAWKEMDFNDSQWETGPSGFGYGDNDDKTVLSDMRNNYLTVYIRKEFTLPPLANVGDLILEVDYDDGFIAYLNGQIVARGNMDQYPTYTYDMEADDSQHEAGTPEVFDLAAYRYLLREGRNVLAIEGHNGDSGSGDLSLIPELRSEIDVLQEGERWIVKSSPLTLTGKAPVVLADSVTVNGIPADYDMGLGTWSMQVSLALGRNEVNVTALGAAGEIVDSKTIEILFVPAERFVGGVLYSDATWTTGPYVVTETLLVGPGVTLTIDPGAEVMLASGQSLVVMGRLLANGNAADPILFTRYTTGQSWGNLVVDQASPSEMSYCVVEYSSSASSHLGNDYLGAVAIYGSHLDIEECTFRNLPDESLTAEGAAVVLRQEATANIRHSHFLSIGAGVHTDRNYVVVENCVFTDLRGDNDAVDINGESSPASVVRNNLIVGSKDDGIDTDRCSPLISGNLIYSSADKGISLGQGVNARVENNVLVGNVAGIAAVDGANAFIVNNTIVGNAIGLELFEKTSGQGGATAGVVNCILWGNGTEITVDGLSSATVSYSVVAGDPVWAGEGNINDDPLFVDSGNQDFRLTKFSLCVDTATVAEAPSQDADGNPRPRGGGVDRGAYESPHWLFVDTDDDGMADGWEGHYFGSLSQAADDDFDQDGMKDGDEFDLGSNPIVTDTDGDGLPDGWEWSNGLSPVSSDGDDGAQGDPDGDGMPNGDEFAAGTAPNDANSTFVVADVTSSEGVVKLRWLAKAGKGYRILGSDDLTSWVQLAIQYPGDEHQAEWLDNSSNGETLHFYKLEVLP